MAALTTLFPVFFMLALGFIARVKGWITLEQKNGANAIIFKILFPILVLNLMCTATIETDHIKIIGYVFGVYRYIFLLLENLVILLFLILLEQLLLLLFFQF